MTNEQMDRLLGLFERYVVVEEAKYAANLQILDRRAKLEERAVAAQEATAAKAGVPEVVHVRGDIRNRISKDASTPNESEGRG